MSEGCAVGLRYFFEIIADRETIDAVLREVAASVTPADRDRLLACIPFSPTTGLKDVRRNKYEGGRSLCLTFPVEPTPEVVDYYAAFGGESESGPIPIGCVWTLVRSGRRFTYLSAMAATSGMSRLFVASPAVQAVFIGIASRARCRAAYLYLDDESQSCRLLWHGRRAVERPAHAEEEEFLSDDEIDDYCAALLVAAGLPIDDPAAR